MKRPVTRREIVGGLAVGGLGAAFGAALGARLDDNVERLVARAEWEATRRRTPWVTPDEPTAGASQAPFALNYAPQNGLFEQSAGPDPVDQIVFAHAHGFRAWEDTGMVQDPPWVQDRVARALSDLDMRMGVFFLADDNGFESPSITRGDRASREDFLRQIRERVDLAKRLNATWMTLLPGLADPALERDFQVANVVESLRRASDLLEPHGLVMVLEPVSAWATPGDLVNDMDLGYLICKAVDSPSCKLLFDVFQQQRLGGNLIETIDRCWDEIAYFQIGDNPGRFEPGTGEINYAVVLAHIASKGYDGLLGLEHRASDPSPEGELALIGAYRSFDGYVAAARTSDLTG